MPEPTMLFIRRYNGLNFGGHLKFFDYARHVHASGLFRTALYVTPESTPMEDRLVPAEMERVQTLAGADAYFIGGIDWQILDRAGIDVTNVPVVNLVQGFAHVQPGDPRRAFLARRALRICVSEPLRGAVAATGLANGPVVCVPNGTDVACAQTPKRKDAGVFIAGVKNAQIAHEVAQRLHGEGLPVETATQALPRAQFLERLHAAGIAVVLPYAHEGFFLPALEAMALGCAVVVPRIEGVESYCKDGVNALLPEYTADAIARAAVRLHRNREELHRLAEGGRQTARAHTLDRERAEFTAALRAYTEHEEPV